MSPPGLGLAGRACTRSTSSSSPPGARAASAATPRPRWPPIWRGSRRLARRCRRSAQSGCARSARSTNHAGGSRPATYRDGGGADDAPTAPENDRPPDPRPRAQRRAIAGVLRLATHDPALRESSRPRLAALRRPRRHRVRPLELLVRGVPRRHGARSLGDDARAVARPQRPSSCRSWATSKHARRELRAGPVTPAPLPPRSPPRRCSASPSSPVPSWCGSSPGEHQVRGQRHREIECPSARRRGHRRNHRDRRTARTW